MKNKLFIIFIIFLGVMACPPSIQAQKKSTVSYKTVTVNGKKYYKHHVTKGETLIGIAKAYKVSVDELIRLNPFVENGLKAGHNLIVPIKVKPKPKPDPETKPKEEPKVDSVPRPKEEPKKEEPKIESEPKQNEVVTKEQEQNGQEQAQQEQTQQAQVEQEQVQQEQVQQEQVQQEQVQEEQKQQEPVEQEQVIGSDDVVAEEVDGSNTLQVVAINTDNTPKIRFNDKDYYLHDVKTGETLEAIAQAYHVSVENLTRYNPDLKEGMKVGMVLVVPILGAQDQEDEPKVEPKNEPKDEPKDEPKKEQEEKGEPKPVPQDEPKEKPESDGIEKPEAKIEVVPIVPTEKPVPNAVMVPVDYMYTVQPREDLYDIAKKFGVDIADLKAINEGLTNDPKSGTVIEIPQIANENDYIVHRCEKNERVTSLLKRWKVKEAEFRRKNVSVGSHVFENQIVLIPIEPITDFYWIHEEVFTEEEEPQSDSHTDLKMGFEEEMGDVPVCEASPLNATRHYNVALMVPLYLQEIGDVEVSKENAAKAQKSRSMSFLQFYEGFMLAAETLEEQGLKLDLTVIDVTDNVSTANDALSQIRGKDLDMIVGPFFGRSFTVIEEYAKAHDIVVVNPLSTRESVIENSPNVVKVKPGDIGMILSISNLVKNAYSNANVFIVSREKASDTAFLNQLEHHLNLAVNEEVTVTGNEFLQFARHESERLEMGSRLVSTLNVEGQVYSTQDFQDGGVEKVVIANPIKRYDHNDMDQLKSQLSGVRTNLIIAYGDDNVFATQILNTLTKEADQFPITLVCVPDWQKHEKLLVENLLKMNAIYVSDFFVDYQDNDVKQFVRRFRNKYVSEPQNYAFEGYDVGYYFLNALMQYGSDDLIGCLHCYEASLLHTHYRFYYRNYLKLGGNYGKENLYWSIYQYDNENIELVPIDPYKKASDHE